MSLEQQEQRGGIRGFVSRIFGKAESQLATQDDIAVLRAEIDSLLAVLDTDKLKTKITEYAEMIRGASDKNTLQGWLEANAPSKLEQEIIVAGAASVITKLSVENLGVAVSALVQRDQSMEEQVSKIQVILGRVREHEVDGFDNLMSIVDTAKQILGQKEHQE